MSKMPRITEVENRASAGLESRTALEILRIMNREDRKVAGAVARAIPRLARAVDLAVAAIAQGGRMVYAGAGTSGRLGVLDASECLPTFNTNKVVAVMAGGRRAMFRSVEGAEDSPALGRQDLKRIGFSKKDLLVGLSASGRTPYMLGALQYARKLGAKTVGITCNASGPMLRRCNVGIVSVVGPEVIAGSSRLKAGTAEKLILNMLSTATMVRLGRTLSGRMISVRMSNSKLRARGEKILMKTAGANRTRARQALAKTNGELPVAMLMLLEKISLAAARRMLREGKDPASVLRKALAGSHEPRGRRPNAIP